MVLKKSQARCSTIQLDLMPFSCRSLHHINDTIKALFFPEKGDKNGFQ